MIELTAYGEEKLLPAGKINREDRIFLHEQKDVEDNQGQRFGLRETEEGLYIKPLNYVGVIQLSELKINIRPRFDGGFSRLIPLLSFCREMDYSFTLRNTGITTGELALEEVVVRLLLEEVEEILNRGAFKEYRTYERNLNVMRGRVDLRKQLTRNQLRGDRLYCRYDELDTDIIENRILLRALNIARRLHAGRDVTRRADRYYHRLARFCEEYRGKGMLELEYNRLNYFYRQAHFYCRLLLENTGTADIYRGQDSGYYTLLLDMNELLEEFVSSLCRKYLPGSYRIRPQKRVTDAVTDADGRCYRYIIPDLYLEDRNSGEKIIIDVKNKDYGSKKVQSGDIYQLAFYGLYFFDFYKDPANVIIVYPEYSTGSGKNEVIRLNTYHRSDGKPGIFVRGIDINYLLDLIVSGKRKNEELEGYVSELVNNMG